jgi:hypothetical protein
VGSLKSTGLAIGSGLRETQDMNKPHLEVTQNDTLALKGKCSSCATYFNVVDPRLQDPEGAMVTLQSDFDKHFPQVHMREYASQAAARIVREVPAANNHGFWVVSFHQASSSGA